MLIGSEKDGKCTDLSDSSFGCETEACSSHSDTACLEKTHTNLKTGVIKITKTLKETHFLS